MFSKEKERMACGGVARIAELAMLAAALALGCVTLLGAQRVEAQSQAAGVYKLNYFTTASSTDELGGWVRITNPGSPPAGAAIIPPDPPSLCALIYVYRPDEEIAECCGCWVSHNALRELSVNVDLTNNPVSRFPLTRGVIKLVSSYNSTGQPPTSDSQCDPRVITPTRTLRAWITHLQVATGIANFTESEFSDAALSDDERAVLQNDCFYAWRIGSGPGRCTCGAQPGP